MNKLIKQLKVACLLALALVTSSALAKLNPKNRPDNLQFSINDNFESLGKFSRWNFDGQSSYSIMQINTTDLAKTIIKTAPKNQKIFYILDLGAGHFQWGNTLFEKLNELADKGELPSDITVNIVSVVGEKYVTEIEEAGICKKYNIANFKVEDLDLSLGRFLYKQDPDNFEENPQFDLIVSQYCFIHLNDPVGTFAQAYNLLRPKSGLMLMQYFAVIDDNVSADDLYRIEGNRAIIDFLLNTKAPFLIGAWGDNRLPYEFLLRRPDDASLNLPMEYASTLDLKLANTVSHPIATFKKLKGYRTFRTQEINLPVSGYWDTKPGDSFYGDVSLFQWLIKNYPGWKKTIVRWEPILKSDRREPLYSYPSPHLKAIYEGNTKKLIELIKNEDDILKLNVGKYGQLIDVITSKGMLKHVIPYVKNVDQQFGYSKKDKDSLTHLATKNLDLDSLKLLADRRADFNMQDRYGDTALHHALSGNKDWAKRLEIIKFLIQNGASLSIANEDEKSPQDLIDSRINKSKKLALLKILADHEKNQLNELNKATVDELDLHWQDLGHNI